MAAGDGDKWVLCCETSGNHSKGLKNIQGIQPGLGSSLENTT